MNDLRTNVGVHCATDVYAARRSARELATLMGFGGGEVEAIVLAVSELGTNLVRYAQGGQLALQALEGGGRTGLRIESRDAGPGLGNVERAFSDGFSSGGGLGSGLGAVARAVDSLEVDTTANGTRIVACKWLSRSSS